MKRERVQEEGGRGEYIVFDKVVLVRLFHYISEDVDSLYACREVCKMWRTLASLHEYWMDHLKRLEHNIEHYMAFRRVPHELFVFPEHVGLFEQCAQLTCRGLNDDDERAFHRYNIRHQYFFEIFIMVGLHYACATKGSCVLPEGSVGSVPTYYLERDGFSKKDKAGKTEPFLFSKLLRDYQHCIKFICCNWGRNE